MPPCEQSEESVPPSPVACCLLPVASSGTEHGGLGSGRPTQKRTVSLMTGAEGGFSEEEIAGARDAGMKICTLGPRILRCETAPLAGLTAIMYALGEM